MQFCAKIQKTKLFVCYSNRFCELWNNLNHRTRYKINLMIDMMVINCSINNAFVKLLFPAIRKSGPAGTSKTISAISQFWLVKNGCDKTGFYQQSYWWCLSVDRCCYTTTTYFSKNARVSWVMIKLRLKDWEVAWDILKSLR